MTHVPLESFLMFISCSRDTANVGGKFSIFLADGSCRSRRTSEQRSLFSRECGIDSMGVMGLEEPQAGASANIRSQDYVAIQFVWHKPSHKSVWWTHRWWQRNITHWRQLIVDWTVASHNPISIKSVNRSLIFSLFWERGGGRGG